MHAIIQKGKGLWAYAKAGSKSKSLERKIIDTNKIMSLSNFINDVNNIINPFRKIGKQYLTYVASILKNYFSSSPKSQEFIDRSYKICLDILENELNEHHFKTMNGVLQKYKKSKISKELSLDQIDEILTHIVSKKEMPKEEIIEFVTRFYGRWSYIFNSVMKQTHYAQDNTEKYIHGPYSYINNPQLGTYMNRQHIMSSITKEQMFKDVLKQQICKKRIKEIQINTITDLIMLCAMIRKSKIQDIRNNWRKKLKRGILRLVNLLSKTRAILRTNPENLKQYICRVNAKNYKSSYAKYELLQAALERLKYLIIRGK